MAALCVALAWLLYPEGRPLITTWHAWWTTPLWIVAGHVLTGLSNAITRVSLTKGYWLVIGGIAAYRQRFSPVHLQAAMTSALTEETFFRYFLLDFLVTRVGGAAAASFATSLIFAAIHYRPRATGVLRYLDLFVFSVLLCSITLATSSLYPACIVHTMRNYLLRVLLVHRRSVTDSPEVPVRARE